MTKSFYSVTRYNYYPYGEERTTTPNGQYKFATYHRDTTGLAYADQRYYGSTAGRFLTPDLSGLNESLGDPQS